MIIIIISLLTPNNIHTAAHIFYSERSLILLKILKKYNNNKKVAIEPTKKNFHKIYFFSTSSIYVCVQESARAQKERNEEEKTNHAHTHITKIII